MFPARTPITKDRSTREQDNQCNSCDLGFVRKQNGCKDTTCGGGRARVGKQVKDEVWPAELDQVRPESSVGTTPAAKGPLWWRLSESQGFGSSLR